MWLVRFLVEWFGLFTTGNTSAGLVGTVILFLVLGLLFWLGGKSPDVLLTLTPFVERVPAQVVFPGIAVFSWGLIAIGRAYERTSSLSAWIGRGRPYQHDWYDEGGGKHTYFRARVRNHGLRQVTGVSAHIVAWKPELAALDYLPAPIEVMNYPPRTGVFDLRPGTPEYVDLFDYIRSESVAGPDDEFIALLHTVPARPFPHVLPAHSCEFVLRLVGKEVRPKDYLVKIQHRPRHCDVSIKRLRRRGLRKWLDGR